MSRQVFPACWVRSVFIAVTSPYALMRLSTEWAKVKSYLQKGRKEQIAPQLPTAHRDVGVTYNAEWWDNNREAVTERFNEWVGS